MTRECAHENCFPDTSCALGHLDRAECDHWNAPERGDPEQAAVAPEEPGSTVPWNGYALGSGDLAVLAGRGRPLVLGLVGPPDSGKTSLLAFLYLWLLEHGRLGDWTFAGSWTLGGWESVVQYCRWTGEPPPSFPPHTSSAGRHPGVLHIAARDKSGNLRDLLFTDAPGEWFTQWARVPADPGAEGARWVIEHSDALLLLVDSAALASRESLPRVRRATRDLIERAAAARPGTPVGVVWTKDDVEVAERARLGVERSCQQFLPHAPTIRTTVKRAESIVECFTTALALADVSAKPKTPEPRLSNDPFLAFRGLHDNG